MDAAHKTSRKRKHVSSSLTSPFTGVLTRQKSQKYFFSCNRSGKSRKCRAFQPLTAAQNLAEYDDSSHRDDRKPSSNGDDDEAVILIKDLRARRVFSKPPKGKSVGTLGKIEANPNFDSLLADGKSDYSSGVSREFGGKPGLLIEEKFGVGDGINNVSFSCGKPNLSVLKKCDLGVEGENPSFPESQKCDGGFSVDLNVEGINVGNPNLVDKCDLGADENSDSTISAKKCEETGVNLMFEGSIGLNPNLLNNIDLEVDGGKSYFSNLGKKCDDVDVDFMSEKSSGGCPNSLVASEKCVSPKKCADAFADSREGLIVGNPNLLAFEKCDNSRIVLRDDDLNATHPNLMEKNNPRDGGGGRVSDILSPDVNGKELKGGFGDSYEVMDDENVQNTPPETLFMFNNIEGQYVLQSRSSASRPSTKRASPTNDVNVEGKKNLSASKKNMTLNLCSRLKVYKTPSSFSYRRLLPFLMDMVKEEPGASKSNPTVETEAEVEQKPAVSSSHESTINGPKVNGMPLANETASLTHEMKTDRVDKVSSDPKAISDGTQEAVAQRPSSSDPNIQVAAVQRPNTSDPSTRLAAVEKLEATDPTTQQSPTQMLGDCLSVVGQKDIVSGQMENQLTYDSVKDILPDEQISSGIQASMSVATLTGEASVGTTSDSPKGSPEASNKEFSLESPYLSVGAGEHRATGIAIKAEKSAINLCQSSPKLAVCVYSGVPDSGPSKGILRRNPRGCRGICSCLNCASLRLNAEKAFEFSRNQLLDAEEIVEDLMKELSNLRSMLGRSLTGADDHAIIPVNLVEETCRNASNVEDTARNRLSQLKEDLYVHCRTKELQRPRVNFSSNVGEKVNRKQT